jgi:hypothetical protein
MPDITHEFRLEAIVFLNRRSAVRLCPGVPGIVGESENGPEASRGTVERTVESRSGDIPLDRFDLAAAFARVMARRAA